MYICKDTFHIILSYINEQDMKDCSLVCKKWYLIIREYILSTKITLNIYYNMSERCSFSDMIPYFTHIDALRELERNKNKFIIYVSDIKNININKYNYSSYNVNLIGVYNTYNCSDTRHTDVYIKHILCLLYKKNKHFILRKIRKDS